MDMQQCYIQAESFGYNMDDLAFEVNDQTAILNNRTVDKVRQTWTDTIKQTLITLAFMVNRGQSDINSPIFLRCFCINYGLK